MSIKVWLTWRTIGVSIFFPATICRVRRAPMCTWVGKLSSRHFWLHLPRGLCLKIMRLESCARQFSIRTIAPTEKWVRGPVETHEQRKFVENVGAEHSPTSVFIRGNMLERLRAGCTLFRDEARRLREPPSTATISRHPGSPEEENPPSSDVSRTRRDAISSRLARTSKDLECVTKWVDIPATQHQT